ncbi:MAG TPA: hypothetical protein VJL90_14315 [Pseudorhodoplanes sp.]|nr:hypothetical protein [Pseudorhodoplanes sp.]
MIEFGGVRRRDVAASARRASAGVKVSECRELVAVEPVTPRENVRMPGNRSSAAFLAHLIATDAGMPQTREKRRLAPAEATRLYVETQASAPPKRARLASL